METSFKIRFLGNLFLLCTWQIAIFLTKSSKIEFIFHLHDANFFFSKIISFRGSLIRDGDSDKRFAWGIFGVLAFFSLSHALHLLLFNRVCASRLVQGPQARFALPGVLLTYGYHSITYATWEVQGCQAAGQSTAFGP